MVWFIFGRLDVSFTTLFWTLFGIIGLAVLKIRLRYVEGFGKLLFGLYNIAARILFLNMLIAMMSKSFNVIAVCSCLCDWLDMLIVGMRGFQST